MFKSTPTYSAKRNTVTRALTSWCFVPQCKQKQCILLNVFLYNLHWQGDMPLPWLTRRLLKLDGKAPFVRHCMLQGFTFSQETGRETSGWKDVFFSTPSVCLVCRGKVGYNKVKGVLCDWIVTSILVSLKAWPGRPSLGQSVVSVLPLTQTLT